MGLAFDLARASKKLIVSTEGVFPESTIRREPERTMIPHYLVDAVVEAPYGAHPGEMCYRYAMDGPLVGDYIEAMKSERSARDYMRNYIQGVRSHEEYIELVGGRRRMARLERRCRRR